MEYHHCFCGLLGRGRKDKGIKQPSEMANKSNGLLDLLKVKVEGLDKSFSLDEILSNSFTFPVSFTGSRASKGNIKSMDHESNHMESVTEEVEDVKDQNFLMNEEKDLQAFDFPSYKDNDQNLDASFDNYLERQREKFANEGLEMVRSRGLSDLGIGRNELWPSAKLARSCSDLGFRSMILGISDQLHPRESQSFVENHGFVEGTPLSAITNWSADHVLLKKHSSGQLGGYLSDTLEERKFSHTRKSKSFDSINESFFENGNLDHNPNGSHKISVYSPTMMRVDQWVEGVLLEHPFQDVKVDDVDVAIESPRASEDRPLPSRSSTRTTDHQTLDTNEETSQANSVVRSMNSSSTVAHMVALGLKVVPQLSQFISLRFVNLSNNSIVHIAPGSLPKSLHTLNLSGNNISVIMGLKELTRLRIVDLSYNRISRIGHGLSGSRLIKELYLAGNKISEVDGLHRLLKLAVVDLSFNKIATTKALGHLVANYNSLKALNLLGNPIHVNVDNDHLRKKLSSLLPELTFLNKQSVNPQKVRQAGAEAIARVALRSNHRAIHRKAVRKVNRVRSAATGH